MIKNIFTSVVTVLVISICAMAQTPEFEFDHDEFDFGNIEQGEVVSHIFSFENKGESPLIITDIVSPCGCTVPEFPENRPVMPGESAEIKVTFDSEGKSGIQRKAITIFANTESNYVLKILANVVIR